MRAVPQGGLAGRSGLGRGLPSANCCADRARAVGIFERLAKANPLCPLVCGLSLAKPAIRTGLVERVPALPGATSGNVFFLPQ